MCESLNFMVFRYSGATGESYLDLPGKIGLFRSSVHMSDVMLLSFANATLVLDSLVDGIDLGSIVSADNPP